MARGDSAGSRFSENFLGGLQTGYDIGERYQEGQRKKAIRIGQEEAVAAGGDMATPEQLNAYYEKLRTTIAGNSDDPEALVKVNQMYAQSLGAKVSEGLKNARLLAGAGDRQGAATALTSAYSFLPNGKQIQVATEGDKYFIRGIDATTGEPTTEGGMQLDDKGLALLAASYEASGPELVEMYRKDAETQSQIKTQEGGLAVDQEGNVIKREQLASGERIAQGQLAAQWGGIAAEYAGQASRERVAAIQETGATGRTQAQINSETNIANLRDSLGRAELDQRDRSSQATVQQNQAELEANRPLRESQTILNEAQAAAAAAKGQGAWDQDSLLSTERGMAETIKNMLEESGLTDEPPVNVTQLQSNGMQIISANTPGSINLAEAAGLAMDMDGTTPTGRPQDFSFEPIPGGNVVVTDRKSGKEFLLPATTVAQITGKPPQAAAPATPAPRQAIPVPPGGGP